ncbi:MAG: hypothetical protein QOH64_985, partial [Acidimicrobiaceae bacterium]
KDDVADHSDHGVMLAYAVLVIAERGGNHEERH